MYHSSLNVKINILIPLVLRAKYEQPLVKNNFAKKLLFTKIVVSR